MEFKSLWNIKNKIKSARGKLTAGEMSSFCSTHVIGVSVATRGNAHLGTVLPNYLWPSGWRQANNHVKTNWQGSVTKHKLTRFYEWMHSLRNVSSVFSWHSEIWL